jgi:hypothetical protein
MDSFSAEWDSDPKSYPVIVCAGIDLVARTPITSATNGVGLTVVGNAPLPVLDTDFVQVPQDIADAILDYAQHVASFKMGGSEFTDTAPLYNNFIQAASETNNRISNLGIFHDLQFEQGLRQDENQERFNGDSRAKLGTR